MKLPRIVDSLSIQSLFRYLRTGLLPLALAILFVIQNQAFNSWLNILANQYVFRRLAVTFALGITLYGPALFFKKTSRYIYLSAITILISTLFVAQFFYYDYYQAFLQVSAFKYIGLAGSALGTIKTLFTPRLLLFISGTVLVSAGFIFEPKKNQPEILLSKKEKIIAGLTMLILIVGGYTFVIDTEKHDWGNTSRLYSDLYDLNTLVGKVGIINFSLEDTAKYILRSNAITLGDKDFLNSWSKSLKEPAGTPGKDFGLAKNRNIIFIQIESLESAVIGQKINGAEITPGLNRLAKEGLYFSNYFTQVGPGNTADAEFVILNSLYPLPDNVAFVDYAKNKYEALPQLLKKNGYHTYSLHGDVPTFWNRSNIYPDLGYDSWISKNNYTVSRPVGKGPSDLGDDDFFSQSLPKLEKLPRPFMATMITLSSHTPFELPADLETLALPEKTNLNYTQQQYLESIHYTDWALTKFIEQLKQTDLYNNSLIVIYGDHGSYTGIGDALGTNKNTLPGLAGSQVPLVILAPKTGLHGTIDAPASHLDLYPTIANLGGIIPPKTILGQDILNTKNPLIARRNIISGTINTILTSRLAYEASPDGIFESGACFGMPEKKSLPAATCKNLYNQEADAIKASDIVIRGNLLDMMLAKN